MALDYSYAVETSFYFFLDRVIHLYPAKSDRGTMYFEAAIQNPSITVGINPPFCFLVRFARFVRFVLFVRFPRLEPPPIRGRISDPFGIMISPPAATGMPIWWAAPK